MKDNDYKLIRTSKTNKQTPRSTHRKSSRLYIVTQASNIAVEQDMMTRLMFAWILGFCWSE